MRQRLWLTCLLVLLAWPALGHAQSLGVRLEGTQLRVNASNFHFITGDALKRLRDGATVAFVFQLGTITSRSGSPQDLVTVRFAVSYDLWEEKFAVTRTGTPSRSISNLSMAAAEQWCLDALSLPAAMPPEQQFWVTLSYREEDPPPALPDSKGSGLSLSGMIEVFSQRVDRRRSSGQKEITGGPFRLSDLRRNR